MHKNVKTTLKNQMHEKKQVQKAETHGVAVRERRLLEQVQEAHLQEATHEDSTKKKNKEQYKRELEGLIKDKLH